MIKKEIEEEIAASNLEGIFVADEAKVPAQLQQEGLEVLDEPFLEILFRV